MSTLPANVCPHCLNLVTLPQEHAFNCPDWRFVSRLSPRRPRVEWLGGSARPFLEMIKRSNPDL